jgi:hypothetical protein
MGREVAELNLEPEGGDGRSGTNKGGLTQGWLLIIRKKKRGQWERTGLLFLKVGWS